MTTPLVGPDLSVEAPTISVVVPCRNAERWIGRAIRSVLDQEYPALDLIVVDDGSTDSSPAIVRSFGERLRFISGSQQGAPAARNRGLRASSADFVLFLDSDDELGAGYLHKLAQAARPGADLVIGRVKQLNDRDETLLDTAYGDVRDPADLLFQYLEHPLQTSGFLWRREFLIDLQGWDESLSIGQDEELAFRLIPNLRDFAIADVSDTWAVWRHHDGVRITSALDQHKMADRLRAILKHRSNMLGLPDARIKSAFARRLYRFSKFAFARGYRQIGRDALREARKLDLVGHPGSFMHRVASTALGLELKTRIAVRMSAAR